MATRRLRPLSSSALDALPDACGSCVFWESERRLPFECGAASDSVMLRERIDGVTEEWGECGRVAFEDGRVLGFIKYAPGRYFPQARNMPAGPPSPDAVLIACMHLAPEARQRGLGGLLLHAALRDLVSRGERTVEAYGTTMMGDLGAVPALGVRFLLRSGFTVVRPHPDTPLLRLELKSLALWSESLESLLDSLRIPMPVRRRAPATFCGGKEHT